MNKKIIWSYIAIIIAIGINVAINLVDIYEVRKLNKVTTATITDYKQWKDSDGDTRYSCNYTYIVDDSDYTEQSERFDICSKDTVSVRYESGKPQHVLISGDDPSSVPAFFSAFITVSISCIVVAILIEKSQRDISKNNNNLQQKIKAESSIIQTYHRVTLIYAVTLAIYYSLARDYLTIALLIFLWLSLGIFFFMSILVFMRGNVLQRVGGNAALVGELENAELMIECDANNIYILSDSIVVSAYTLKRIYYRDIVSVRENYQIERYLMCFEITLSNGKKRTFIAETEKQVKDIKKSLLAHKVSVEEK